VFLPAPPTSFSPHSIIFEKKLFFKNDLQIILFEIFPKHTFWNTNSEFIILQVKKYVIKRIFQNDFSSSKFSYRVLSISKSPKNIKDNLYISKNVGVHEENVRVQEEKPQIKIVKMGAT